MDAVSFTNSPLGVVVVLYKSGDVIEACLKSLLEQRPHIGRIVLVDNCCPADSVSVVQSFATQTGICVSDAEAPDLAKYAAPRRSIELIRSNQNLGFAGGVNLGLRVLHADPGIDFFWILNPDCELAVDCAENVLTTASASASEGGFAILGTRILYRGSDRTIQSDGGICCSWTGRCRNLNQGTSVDDVSEPVKAKLNFISGASMVASRTFIDLAGLMPESYFLYYEEVAWARQRHELPLIMCHDATVLHHGGTAIGSGAYNRSASPLSTYFNFRNRMRFVARFQMFSLPVTYAFSLFKIVQTIGRGEWQAAVAAFRGTHGMPPNRTVRNAFRSNEHRRAFASRLGNKKRVDLQDQRTPA